MSLYAWTNTTYNATIYTDTLSPVVAGPFYDNENNNITTLLNNADNDVTSVTSSEIVWTVRGKGYTIPPTSTTISLGTYYYNRDSSKDIIETMYVSNLSDGTNTYVIKDSEARTSISNLATVATSGSYNDLSNKPTIPTVNNPTITFTQGGTTKGTITLNQSSNQTVAFDAGGGGSSYAAGTGIDITNNEISVDNTIAFTDLSNLNVSGESLASGLGMPSSTYSNLTLGASGASYTAPANGWFVLNKVSGANDKYINMNNLSNGVAILVFSRATNAYMKAYIPALKGQKVQIDYTITGSTNYLRFVYAKGSESEA